MIGNSSVPVSSSCAYISLRLRQTLLDRDIFLCRCCFFVGGDNHRGNVWHGVMMLISSSIVIVAYHASVQTRTTIPRHHCRNHHLVGVLFRLGCHDSFDSGSGYYCSFVDRWQSSSSELHRRGCLVLFLVHGFCWDHLNFYLEKGFDHGTIHRL